MDYQDIGFANIRVPNDDNRIYQYASTSNVFPEEAFIHEFLHNLERISRENGLEYPVLHDYEQYGYQVQAREGLRNWYSDFMTRNIKSNGKYIGVAKEVYSIKPIHKTSFNYSMEIKLHDDPENIIEEIKTIFNVITSSIGKREESKQV